MKKKRERNKNKKESLIEIKNYSQSGASRTKNSFKGTPDILRNADEDIGDNKEILMTRSRRLYMGNSIATAAIKKIRTNVVGKGLKLKSTINNDLLNLDQEKVEEIEKQIEFLWNLWAGSTECDFDRFSNFYQLQSLAMLNMLIDGECFTLLPFKQRKGEIFELKIQLLDSALCDNPSSVGNKDIKNGVELDSDGIPVRYYFKKDDKSSDTVTIEAYGNKTGRKNILVLMEKERVGQRRGVPLLAPVIESLHQITKFTEAELTNAALSALFSVFIEYDKTDPGLGAENPIEGVEYEEGNMKLGSGTILDLKPGQKISFADPQRPNAKFDIFVTAMTKYIGAALEIPYEVLTNSFNSSYSASRAALLEVWKMYLMRREWFITDFCQPIYEEFLDEVVAKGYIDLKGYFDNPLIRKSYQQSEWHGQAQGQLNPLVEVKASIAKIEAGLSTRARETRELNGSDFMMNHEQIKIEQKKRKELENVLESNK